MVTFDAPIERCPVCKEYVLMDQAQQECAGEHSCDKGEKCPLAHYFTGAKYKTDRNDNAKNQI